MQKYEEFLKVANDLKEKDKKSPLYIIKNADKDSQKEGSGIIRLPF